MTCETCGDKPKKDRHFPSAVVEINNPEQLVLLRKMVIPSSLGDDVAVPPAIGKYRNVVLVYEANNHIYLYSSDGIPTKIDATVPQEVLDRITELELDVDLLERSVAVETEARERADGVLQQEIDDLKNSPDVVDIVATYADLMAYDTSSLGDKDVIRVLADETHEGQSDYYRWSTATETWTFIGTVGNYYTKGQIDDLLDEKQDELTPGENVSIVDESGELVISARDTTYTAGYGLELNGTEFSVDSSVIQDTLVAGDNITIEDESGSLVISATDTTYNNFVGTDGTTAGQVGLVPAPTTTDAGKVLGSNGNWVTGGPNVVQTTGTSTTDVMSQNAATSMVFADPSTKQKIQVGGNSNASGGLSVAIGYGAETMPIGNGSIALGHSAQANNGAIAIGRGTQNAVAGTVSFQDTNWGTSGYNSTGYRLLTGLYDPQNAHDAATKGYVDSAVTGIESELDAKQDVLTAGDNITIADESGDLVISATDTTYSAFTGTDGSAAGTSGLVPAPSTADAGKVLGANGGWVTGGPTVVQTTGTSQTDVMSQNAVTSMVYADPASKSKIQIGINATSSQNSTVAVGAGAAATGNYGVAVGNGAGASGYASIAIGWRNGQVGASGGSSIAIGSNTDATADNAVAIGSGAQATVKGQFDISTSKIPSQGYNGSAYRLLTGLYDGQSAHDAATKGQLDAAVTNIGLELDGKQDELTAGTGISITDESGALVISATGAEAETISAQDWSNLWQ